MENTVFARRGWQLRDTWLFVIRVCSCREQWAVQPGGGPGPSLAIWQAGRVPHLTHTNTELWVINAGFSGFSHCVAASTRELVLVSRSKQWRSTRLLGVSLGMLLQGTTHGWGVWGIMDVLGLIYVKELKFRTKSSFCERWQRIGLPRPDLGLQLFPSAGTVMLPLWKMSLVSSPDLEVVY